MRNQPTYGRGAQKPSSTPAAPANAPSAGTWGQPADQKPAGQGQGQWGQPAGQQPEDKGFRGLNRGFAKFEVMGNLSKDANQCEVRSITDAKGEVHHYVTVPLVVSRGKSEPFVVLVTFWGGLGKAVWENKVKGQALLVHGEMTTRQSENNGQYYTNWNAQEVEFLN